MSLKSLAVKNFKIPRWQTAAILNIDKLQYLVMIQNRSLKRFVVHLGFLKEIFCGLHTWHILHHHAKFCGDCFGCIVAEISRVFVFSKWDVKIHWLIYNYKIVLCGCFYGSQYTEWYMMFDRRFRLYVSSYGKCFTCLCNTCYINKSL